MDVFEAIEKRHSYRGNFADKPVPREDLVKIVSAGIRAPSGKNAQTTSFAIIDDPLLVLKIAEIADRSFMKSAKAIIVCAVEFTPVFHGFSFEVEDCAAAVENMLLAITALGYATVWIDGNLRLEGKSGRIETLLNIPKPMHVRIILPIGVPEEKCVQNEKKPFNERAWFNQYESHDDERT